MSRAMNAPVNLADRSCCFAPPTQRTIENLRAPSHVAANSISSAKTGFCQSRGALAGEGL